MSALRAVDPILTIVLLTTYALMFYGVGWWHGRQCGRNSATNALPEQPQGAERGGIDGCEEEREPEGGVSEDSGVGDEDGGKGGEASEQFHDDTVARRG